MARAPIDVKLYHDRQVKNSMTFTSVDLDTAEQPAKHGGVPVKRHVREQGIGPFAFQGG